MAGRRWLTLLAMAAALVLTVPMNTSWAHPGNGHGQARGKVHAAQRHTAHPNAADGHKARAHGANPTKAHLHRAVGHHAVGHHAAGHHPARHQAHQHQHTRHEHGRHGSSGKRDGTLQPASQPAVRTASNSNGRGHAYGRTHDDLASHPGRALGLLKHADQPVIPVTGPPQQSSPPPAPTGGGGVPPITTSFNPQPAPQGAAPNTATPNTPHSGNHGGSPPTTGSPPPSTQQPPPKQQHHTFLARLISKPMRFTVLPILIISILAVGVCGLVGLARHRA
jgi:hypothetical protein